MLNHWYKRDYRLSENQSVAKMLKMLQNDFLPHEKNILLRKAKYLCIQGSLRDKYFLNKCKEYYKKK